MKLKLGRSKLPKFIKGIVILNAASQRLGATIERLELVPKRRRRRSRGALRILERIALRRARARAREANEYRRLHFRSNRKRRDGWLSELISNRRRAARKAGRIGPIGRIGRIRSRSPLPRISPTRIVRRLAWRAIRRRLFG